MSEGDRIRLIRTINKLSQKEFGEILGIKQNAVGKIELDKNDITKENLKKICEHFEVSADFILFGKDEGETISNLLRKKEGK